MPGHKKEKIVVVPVATYKEGSIIGDADKRHRQWKSNRQIHHFYFCILLLFEYVCFVEVVLISLPACTINTYLS